MSLRRGITGDGENAEFVVDEAFSFIYDEPDELYSTKLDLEPHPKNGSVCSDDIDDILQTHFSFLDEEHPCDISHLSRNSIPRSPQNIIENPMELEDITINIDDDHMKMDVETELEDSQIDIEEPFKETIYENVNRNTVSLGNSSCEESTIPFSITVTNRFPHHTIVTSPVITRPQLHGETSTNTKSEDNHSFKIPPTIVEILGTTGNHDDSENQSMEIENFPDTRADKEPFRSQGRTRLTRSFSVPSCKTSPFYGVPAGPNCSNTCELPVHENKLHQATLDQDAQTTKFKEAANLTDDIHIVPVHLSCSSNDSKIKSDSHVCSAVSSQRECAELPNNGKHSLKCSGEASFVDTSRCDTNVSSMQGQTLMEANNVFAAYSLTENISHQEQPESDPPVKDLTVASVSDNISAEQINNLLLSSPHIQTYEAVNSSIVLPRDDGIYANTPSNTVGFTKTNNLPEPILQPILASRLTEDPSHDGITRMDVNQEMSEHQNGSLDTIQDELVDTPDMVRENGLRSSLTRIWRRSMRRMQQFRMSGKRSKRPTSEAFAYYNEGIVSDECEGRRDISDSPHLGFSTVRSPSTSAVLLPTIMASLAPEGAPREQLSPRMDLDTSSERESTSDQTIFAGRRLSNEQTSTESPCSTSLEEIDVGDPAPVYTSDTSLNENSGISTETENDDQAMVSGRRIYSVPGVSSSQFPGETSHWNRRRRRLGTRRTQRSSRSRSRSQIGYITPLREYWPHNLSGLMTCLPLVVNTFNISRFAVFGATYGWQFPIQWGVMSLAFGLPLMTFQMTLGQLIGAGPIDMWVISPVFQGIGLALLLSEIVLGVYCCVPIAWLFTFFRDSFDMRHFRCITSYDCNSPSNISQEINEVVSQFFTSKILGRPEEETSTLSSLGSIQFNLTFNLLSIWIIIFLTLSKGAKSLGKICYLSFLLPLLCYLAVCCYLIYVSVTQLPMSSFNPEFLDQKSWMAAAREAFLVWALHGAALQQLAAGNKKGHPLWRDTTVIVILTACVLCLASFFGIVCSTVLTSRTLKLIPSSFETSEGRHFIAPLDVADDEWSPFVQSKILMESNLHFFGPRDTYDNFYTGIRIKKYAYTSEESTEVHLSGYNSLRLITEIFPALLFNLRIPMAAYIPPLFTLSLLLFGLSHQLALWYAIIQGIMRLNYIHLRPMEAVITFCCCVFGFSAALPMVTGAGIHILYFLDYIVGSAWWLMVLQLIQIFAVPLIRGKPFAAGDIARELFGDTRKNFPLKNAFAFAWTVLAPIGLGITTIYSFRSGDYRKVLIWDCPDWPVWVCQIATGMQLFPLFLVVFVAVVKSCIFLVKSRGDSIYKLEYLYRPPPFRDAQRRTNSLFNESEDSGLDIFGHEGSSRERRENQNRVLHDPPPKYTPPPSYSTATGSSLAKILRRASRRETVSTHIP